MPNSRWRDGPEDGRYLRPYAITRGRTHHSQHGFALITHVVTRSDDEVQPSHLEPEATQILELCRNRAMAVAEIAAELNLPVSVVKVLCGDLLDASLVLVQAPPGRDNQPSVEVIERVINAIREL
ncbi:hypothetical protein GCM10011579_098200 [Streptomyces albiflavescens]|uniref:DUF742 domain-containing protein n=1 Tax=Streptomyces albiflavescens TaxID=1623582 RepID=A0A917YGB6_9ACTN|nr:DUF742 domain-containing protein [Streptomyces albiflavescens]GGN96587.1 hypothetical protein GCM10011579_098200 [Streptomyces albiflavescens]